MIYRFLDYELDTSAFSLRCEGLVTPIDPRAFST